MKIHVSNSKLCNTHSREISSGTVGSCRAWRMCFAERGGKKACGCARLWDCAVVFCVINGLVVSRFADVMFALSHVVYSTCDSLPDPYRKKDASTNNRSQKPQLESIATSTPLERCVLLEGNICVCSFICGEMCEQLAVVWFALSHMVNSTCDSSPDPYRKQDASTNNRSQNPLLESLVTSTPSGRCVVGGKYLCVFFYLWRSV